jgi:hypothetical protein
VFGELMSLGGRLLALQSLLTLEKGTRAFNFQSKELLKSFYDSTALPMILFIFTFEKLRTNKFFGLLDTPSPLTFPKNFQDNLLLLHL